MNKINLVALTLVGVLIGTCLAGSLLHYSDTHPSNGAYSDRSEATQLQESDSEDTLLFWAVVILFLAPIILLDGTYLYRRNPAKVQVFVANWIGI